ncbi:MAG: protoheme IX farnesyltransferase [Polyangiaceae bacterium]|nr:protoheme IX farnesyltransferase [Polyangiaceae bacterium]
MSSEAVPISTRTFAASPADFVALAKPRVTLLVVVTMLGGMFLAPGEVRPWSAALVTLGTAMIVAGANSLNMFLERESDKYMQRTASRPLPSGRMHPHAALMFGAVTTVGSIPLLLWGANVPTTVLAVAANVSYVGLYTPLKPRTWLALVVGAVPGAIPPLLGYVSVRGAVDLAGLSLFLVLFVWQIPHFHAIALFRREDYARAGLVVLPGARGVPATKLHIAATTAVLLLVSLLPYLTGTVGPLYVPAAGFLGAVLFAWAVIGLRPEAGDRWARSFFGASMPYLVLLFAAMLATK